MLEFDFDEEKIENVQNLIEKMMQHSPDKELLELERVNILKNLLGKINETLDCQVADHNKIKKEFRWVNMFIENIEQSQIKNFIEPTFIQKLI